MSSFLWRSFVGFPACVLGVESAVKGFGCRFFLVCSSSSSNGCWLPELVAKMFLPGNQSCFFITRGFSLVCKTVRCDDVERPWAQNAYWQEASSSSPSSRRKVRECDIMGEAECEDYEEGEEGEEEIRVNNGGCGILVFFFTGGQERGGGFEVGISSCAQLGVRCHSYLHCLRLRCACVACRSFCSRILQCIPAGSSHMACNWVSRVLDCLSLLRSCKSLAKRPLHWLC